MMLPAPNKRRMVIAMTNTQQATIDRKLARMNAGLAPEDESIDQAKHTARLRGDDGYTERWLAHEMHHAQIAYEAAVDAKYDITDEDSAEWRAAERRCDELCFVFVTAMRAHRTHVNLHRIINNLWTEAPQMADVCDWGGTGCPGPVTMILAMRATGTDGPATAERRPLCSKHGEATMSMLRGGGFDFETWEVS